MTQNLYPHILFDVTSENKGASWFRRAFFILGLVFPFCPVDCTVAFGEETGFKAYLKATQQEIIRKQAIIEEDPMDFQSYFELGLTFLKLGRHKDEVQAYREALSLNPKSALTHYNLSIAYDHLKEGGKAIHHMQRAQDLYVEKRNHRQIRNTQRQLKRYYLSYPDHSEITIPGR